MGINTINANNINLERIRFQVDGNTILHYFALDYNRLSFCLDYFEENRFEYLTAILMKNNKGKSPLDIALDQESPKNVELLLRKLILFKDMSLSKLFYDRFNQLLAMNIMAFHEFLDSCFFQTMQMKATKYLKLKKNKDPWLVPHSSCLIDNVFIEKYCRNDEKKIMEILARKKEREEKEKEERLKRRSDRRKAKIEKKKTELKLSARDDKNDTSGPLLAKNSISDGVDLIENTLDENNGKTERALREESKNDISKLPTELANGASAKIEKPEDHIDVSDDDSEEETKDTKKTKEELELEKERKKQKKLDIKAIEFDWIFNKVDGAEFMKTLSETENIELFSLTMIRYIIKFMWGFYRKAILMYLFYPFFIYFWIFLVYTTWVQHREFEENDGHGGFTIASIIMVVICLVFQIYFLYYEIRQMCYHKVAYFTTFWNMVDLTSLALNFIIMIGDLSGAKEEVIVSFSGIAVLFMWLKMFYFGRIFLSTAAMIRMIIEITVDMKYFLFVFIISIAAFGNCFFILARNGDGTFTGGTYFRAFLYTYRQALGDFDTSGFASNDQQYLQFLWFSNTMITLIIFLNMLIAIMGDTFDRVQETTENNMLKELASLMVENELLINRNAIFGDAKYVIIIQEEQADASAVNWKGRLKHLKKYMDNAVLEQSKLLNSLEKLVDSEIREKAERKAKEIESNTNNNFNRIFDKCEYLDDRIKDLEQELLIAFKQTTADDGDLKIKDK